MGEFEDESSLKLIVAKDKMRDVILSDMQCLNRDLMKLYHYIVATSLASPFNPERLVKRVEDLFSQLLNYGNSTYYKEDIEAIINEENCEIIRNFLKMNGCNAEDIEYVIDNYMAEFAIMVENEVNQIFYNKGYDKIDTITGFSRKEVIENNYPQNILFIEFA